MRRTLLGLALLSSAAMLWWFSSSRAAPLLAASSQAAATRSRETLQAADVGARADAFYPGFDSSRDKLPASQAGGRVVIYAGPRLSSLNFMISNSSVTRRIWGELHDSLIRQDMNSWEYLPALAQSYTVQDQLVLEGGNLQTGDRVLVGKIEDQGDHWDVESREGGAISHGRVAKAAGQSFAPGTVFDFHLRQGVHWQDGAEFDARDVLFSMRCFRNPEVNCDEKRYQFDKIARFESSAPHEVRFCFAQPYFLARNLFEGLTILPAHLYDLGDERNPGKKAAASDAEQAAFIEEHPANRQWVGLGPYKLAEFSDAAIVAKRWDGYYDKAAGGHVDEIVWRFIADDGAALTALLEGGVDYFDRLNGEDYFGGRTDNEAFRSNFYKGYSYGPQITYTAWNTRREKFKDPRVRTALGMCFDWDAFIASYYKGLAQRVTGEQYIDGPAYDKTLTPLPFDLDRARGMLAEAGWYDRDQDGIVDRDGVELEIEFLYPTGNRTSELFGQAFQASLKKVGVELRLQARDWSAMLDSKRKGDFDALSMGWITPLVVDPEPR